MLRIATRRSPLALWQAEWVAGQLEGNGFEVELVLLVSEGDTHQAPIDGSQGVGLFTKAIQRAVLDNRADIAVHSLKDLPTQLDTGLTLAAVPTRAPVEDCLVSHQGMTLDELPSGARVGTGSRRRQSQLLARRPDLKLESIRGNVQTRLGRLDPPSSSAESRTSHKTLDAVVLAKAGLTRLGMERYVTVPLPLEWMLPAPGQGALGIEVRRDDQVTAEAVGCLNEATAHAAVAAERQVLRVLKAGCLAPVGAYANIDSNVLTLDAVVLSVDGKTRLTASGRVSLSSLEPQQMLAQAERLGSELADTLLAQGAGPLIQSAHHP